MEMGKEKEEENEEDEEKRVRPRSNNVRFHLIVSEPPLRQAAHQTDRPELSKKGCWWSRQCSRKKPHSPPSCGIYEKWLEKGRGEVMKSWRMRRLYLFTSAVTVSLCSGVRNRIFFVRGSSHWAIKSIATYPSSSGMSSYVKRVLICDWSSSANANTRSEWEALNVRNEVVRNDPTLFFSSSIILPHERIRILERFWTKDRVGTLSADN